MLVSYKWLNRYVDLSNVTPKELADKITWFPGICRLPTLSAHDKSGCCGTCPHSKLLFPACLAVGVAQAAVKSVPANRNRGKMLLVFIFI